jgi:diamine N-acetyltransferase
MKISLTKDYELIATLNKPVHDLHVELYPDLFKPYNYEEFKTFFADMVNKEKFKFLLLVDEGQALGFAMVELRDYPETIFRKSYQSMYVHQLSILENHRNKGYGSRLMEKIKKIAKENGIHKIELDYWANNSTAKSFYKKNDYLVSREIVYKDLL